MIKVSSLHFFTSIHSFPFSSFTQYLAPPTSKEAGLLYVVCSPVVSRCVFNWFNRIICSFKQDAKKMLHRKREEKMWKSVVWTSTIKLKTFTAIKSVPIRGKRMILWNLWCSSSWNRVCPLCCQIRSNFFQLPLPRAQRSCVLSCHLHFFFSLQLLPSRPRCPRLSFISFRYGLIFDRLLVDLDRVKQLFLFLSFNFHEYSSRFGIPTTKEFRLSFRMCFGRETVFRSFRQFGFWMLTTRDDEVVKL